MFASPIGEGATDRSETQEDVMSRRFEITVLAAALAIAAPLGSAFAATRHHVATPQPIVTEPQATVAPAANGWLAANGAAAVRRSVTLEQAELSGHGGEGGNN